ncbi:hypothetical protein B0A50_07060 [Salinomyces thailandicus]|uniref:Uncharacterized protein n=1 Tax=Salinomyces thailandicus TaxID=706561 RepID=A0A4U0TP20_9PEZI|nr:hypothetical protein B0A50_07060 [Salinomyces thailandica]
MPRPKYRKPPTKEHKERLEAFSFSDAWRRKSYQSTYSPMGTRAPSRRNSLFSLASRKKSFRSPRSSRANSVTSADMEKGSVRQREGNLYGGAAMKTTRLSPEAEAEGDDDITNVGLSRIQSREAVPPSRPIPAGDHPSQSNGLPPQMTTAHDHNVFSEHELSMAMQRSHLTVPAR